MDDGAPSRLFTGTVTRGRGFGRELGFPTANLDTPPEELPAKGVYAARVFLEKRSFKAAAFIGSSPLGGHSGGKVLELHLLDFRGDLYGKKLSARLHAFVRPVRRFGSADRLRDAIRSDIEKIRLLLEKEEE